MDRYTEDWFFARRGKAVDAREVLALVGPDEARYRQALSVAHGNNVRIRNEFRSRFVDTSAETIRADSERIIRDPVRNPRFVR